MTVRARPLTGLVDRVNALSGIALGSLLVGVSYFTWPPDINPAIELTARSMIGIPLGLAVVVVWRVAAQNRAEEKYHASFEARVSSASPAEWDILCRVAQAGDERATLQTDDPVVVGLLDAGLLVRLGDPSLYGDSASYGLSDEARNAVISRCRRVGAAA